MRIRFAMFAVAAALALALTGCSLVGRVAHTSPASSTSAPSSSVAPAQAAGTYSLVQEPQAGYSPVYSFISGAQKSLEMTMYEDDDPQADATLISDAKRGVDVQVILDKAYSGGKVNAAAYAALSAGGVHVMWAPSSTVYHQKTITRDGDASLVMTGNLTPRYYATTRDAIVEDTVPAQVQSIVVVFDADWSAGPHAPLGASAINGGAPGLIWSPDAQSAFIAAIKGAKTSVDVTSEEMKDTKVEYAIEDAAHRGVKCEVVLTQDSEWTRALDYLASAGCSVHLYPDTSSATYMHEKVLLTDGTNLIIGSQNIGTASLLYNRELSVQLTSAQAPDVVSAVQSQFDADYAAAPAMR